MTDRALLAIAKSPTIVSIDSFDCIQPLWLSRGIYRAEVLEVIRKQLDLEATKYEVMHVATKTKSKPKARLDNRRQRETSSTSVPNTANSAMELPHSFNTRHYKGPANALQDEPMESVVEMARVAGPSVPRQQRI